MNLRLLRLFFFLTIVLSSFGCKKHAGCTEFGTENYDPEAVINDGSCILVRDKFLGLFSVTSDCFVDPYQRSIEPTADKFVVIINNLADTLGTVQARVFENNITIDAQTIRTGIVVEGAGIFTEEGKVSISYRVRDNRNGTQVLHDCLEICEKL